MSPPCLQAFKRPRQAEVARSKEGREQGAFRERPNFGRPGQRSRKMGQKIARDAGQVGSVEESSLCLRRELHISAELPLLLSPSSNVHPHLLSLSLTRSLPLSLAPPLRRSASRALGRGVWSVSSKPGRHRSLPVAPRNGLPFPSGPNQAGRPAFARRNHLPTPSRSARPSLLALSHSSPPARRRPASLRTRDEKSKNGRPAHSETLQVRLLSSPAPLPSFSFAPSLLWASDGWGAGASPGNGPTARSRMDEDDKLRYQQDRCLLVRRGLRVATPSGRSLAYELGQSWSPHPPPRPAPLGRVPTPSWS